MAEDQHPADDMIEHIGHAVMGIFNGDNIRQTIRDAWDRHMNSAPENSTAQQMTNANNVKAVQDANKAFLDASQAAKIRMKAAK